MDEALLNRALERGVEQVYPSREELEKKLKAGKKIRIYFGIDPTSPSLHIGHAIGLRKLRDFQELGHEVILLIGSFTAMIGDPTDKEAARKQLSRKEVLNNAADYKKQASNILRFRGKNAAKIKFNHKWLGELSFGEVVELASHFTVQQMSERDMFERRLKDGKPVYLHEFLYPLMQGYDSVAMDVDLEIGGSDQLFNMLAGRTLLKQTKEKEKFVLTTKLLTNAHGDKMSKTASGFIALNNAPEDMYGKLMAMDDSMIIPYFELATDVPKDEIEGMRIAMEQGRNPRDTKAKLAFEVVSLFYDEKQAKAAQEHFEKVFQEGETPEDMPEYTIKKKMSVVDLLADAELTSSKTEARSMLKQGAVRIDGNKVKEDVDVDPDHAPLILQRGKRRFVRIIK